MDAAPAALDRAIAAAERSLRDEERESAESHYRSALLEGWLLMGGLEIAEGRLAEAREAFRHAATSAVETQRALKALALVHLQMGEPADAVKILTPLAAKTPKDPQIRRLLAQALVAAGRPEQAVQELAEARATAPNDLEVAFTLAAGYLKLKKVDAAARLFAEVAKGRPIPQTHVLIGRTYRDFGEYDRARAELRAALAQDPRVRHAHCYLGMIAVTAEGPSRIDEAITEFREELKVSPQDALTNLNLGMALVEARRPAEALAPLELASGAVPPQANAFYYLGRCQLGLDRATDAVASLRRALELAQGQGAGDQQVGGVHYQLAQALRRLGEEGEAATHFAEAERYSASGAESSRRSLARYLADVADPQTAPTAAALLLESSPLVNLTASQRVELRRLVRAALARTNQNLGVLQAQSEHFAQAAELFEKAAAVDPDFPQVQYSLGVAYFNAKLYDKAGEPLARALAGNPEDAGLKRMLALSSLNTGAYAKAAELLRDDPERQRNPSLQYAYGLALVRSNHGAEAEEIFSRLLAEHGDSAEVNVVLGQAYAQQGDYESAIKALQRARELSPDVAEANAALGVIFLKQGRLAEAEEALRAELKAHPSDVKSQQDLASVLDLLGRSDEALPLLRSALRSKPDFADARYLLGKILLAQGAAPEAVEHLEAAARLAPDEANIRYQLGQAYQKLGRTELAQQQFEAFRQLKEKRRGNAP